MRRPAPDPADAGQRELLAVREIVHAFLTAQRPADVFQFALDRVSPLVGAAFSCIYLVDADSELMRLAAVHEWPPRYAPFLGEMRVRLGSGPSGEAASERRVIEIPDVFADEALADWQEVARELGFRGIVALPLQASGAVLGAVTFYFTDVNPSTPESRHLLRTVADQMAATAEKARLIDDLQHANAHLAETNAELERQYAALLEARRVKDEFLANISHELRTPLTAVIGYTELMHEGLVGGPVSEAQGRTLAQVKSASEQLLHLIDDLIELTTLRRGGLEVVAVELDPRVPMRQAVERAGTPPEGVTLHVDEPDIVPKMFSDGKKVEKVLASVLGNAYKFTRAGAVHVTLRVDTGRGRVVYTVRDSGIGVPGDAREFIFDEFRQADGSSTRRYGGSGLGLALARRLARLLGGDIVLETASGTGSTFRVELPLQFRES